MEEEEEAGQTTKSISCSIVGKLRYEMNFRIYYDSYSSPIGVLLVKNLLLFNDNYQQIVGSMLEFPMCHQGCKELPLLYCLPNYSWCLPCFSPGCRGTRLSMLPTTSLTSEPGMRTSIGLSMVKSVGLCKISSLTPSPPRPPACSTTRTSPWYPTVGPG